MGCTESSHEAKAASRKIDIQLREDKKRLEEELKLLLLGAGESGKSTIAKQLKIINIGPYTEQELKDWKTIVLDNTLLSVKTLVLAADKLGIQLETKNSHLVEKIKDLNTFQSTLTPELGKEIKILWQDPGVQATYEKRSQFQLPDNAKYCLGNIERISDPDYIPTQDDVIHCRVRTTGVIETVFEMGKRKIRLVDVGGQRAERRKWMTCFEDVTAVIFVTALSEYDQRLAEDDTTNRMHESLAIFEELVQKWFLKTTIILFLNKSDLFRDKIQTVDLKCCFPEYTGGCNYEKGTSYIENKFFSLDKYIDESGIQKKRIFTHITCATDTNNVRVVFEAVKETLINANLAAAGLI